MQQQEVGATGMNLAHGSGDPVKYVLGRRAHGSKLHANKSRIYNGQPTTGGSSRRVKPRRVPRRSRPGKRKSRSGRKSRGGRKSRSGRKPRGGRTRRRRKRHWMGGALIRAPCGSGENVTVPTLGHVNLQTGDQFHAITKQIASSNMKAKCQGCLTRRFRSGSRRDSSPGG